MRTLAVVVVKLPRYFSRIDPSSTVSRCSTVVIFASTLVLVWRMAGGWSRMHRNLQERYSPPNTLPSSPQGQIVRALQAADPSALMIRARVTPNLAVFSCRADSWPVGDGEHHPCRPSVKSRSTWCGG